MTDTAHGPFAPAPLGAAAAGTPPPPAGPGVQPPFAAPPTEGRTARVWLGLGVAGLAVVLCCGGGLAAMAGVVVTANAAINEQAHAAVEDYLQAVGAGKYGEAYQMLCDELRDRQSRGEFTGRVSGQPRVTEYELFKARVRNDGDVAVPADVTYTDGTRTDVTYRVTQEAGGLRFCGTTG